MKEKGKNIFVALCMIPATLLLLIFMFYPTISVFYMSLFKWGGLSYRKTFIGLSNFKFLMEDKFFIKSFQNTILLIVVVTIVTLIIAITFAAILTKDDIPGNNVFRVLFYIPNILSIAVIAAIFSAVYDSSNGLLNSFFRIFNPTSYKNIQFLGNKNIVIYSVAGALIWQGIGYYMVMYMSSMASIPKYLYEAAEIDGASKIRQFFDITLPLIWDTIRTTLTFFIISTINLSFQLVKILTNGNPEGASDVFLSYMYKQSYVNASYGYGMAIGVIVFIFSFILSAIISKVTKRDTLQY